MLKWGGKMEAATLAATPSVTLGGHSMDRYIHVREDLDQRPLPCSRSKPVSPVISRTRHALACPAAERCGARSPSLATAQAGTGRRRCLGARTLLRPLGGAAEGGIAGVPKGGFRSSSVFCGSMSSASCSDDVFRRRGNIDSRPPLSQALFGNSAQGGLWVRPWLSLDPGDPARAARKRQMPPAGSPRLKLFHSARLPPSLYISRRCPGLQEMHVFLVDVNGLLSTVPEHTMNIIINNQDHDMLA